jgi:agmatine deiminase
MIPGTCFAVRRVLEGGSIDVNGKGDCLTTEQCLLNSNRNPSCSQKDIERFLRDYLGILRVFWLKGGIAGDDTDGHVDDVARFVGPKTIVAAYEENPKDENYAALRENWERLQNLKRTKFRSLNLIKLPMPSRIIDSGKRLPASYANFYICNQAVLLPVFGDPRDKQAIAILQKLFRTRKVVPIPSRSLVYGHGAIHCVTMHEPA